MTTYSQVKQTIAGLKGVQGTLRIYELQSQDKETKEIYSQAIHETSDIIKDIEKRLQTLEFQEPQFKGN